MFEKKYDYKLLVLQTRDLLLISDQRTYLHVYYKISELSLKRTWNGSIMSLAVSDQRKKNVSHDLLQRLKFPSIIKPHTHRNFFITFCMYDE